MGSEAALLVRAATDIVELIGEVTPVKRINGAAKALCPFHPDKDTPSLSVDSDKGLYHCFGCDAGGDALTFVQEHTGVGFREALDLLARRAGIDLGPSARPTRAQRLDTIRWQTAQFTHGLLKSDPSATAARAYLRGTHGYGSSDVVGFSVGWAPSDESVLPTHLRSIGVSDRDMTAAGVAHNVGGRVRARLSGRVLYPVVTGPERVAGFAAESGDGRVEHPHRGEQMIYGLGKARSAIARGATAVVVADYPSVIAHHRVGLDTAVAPCSGRLTAEHLRTVARYGSRAVVVTSTDEATEQILASDLRCQDLDLYIGQTPTTAGASLTGDIAAATVASAVPVPEARLVTALAGYRSMPTAARRRAKLAAAVGVIQAEPDEQARIELAAAAAALTGLPVERVLGAPTLLDLPAAEPTRTVAAVALSL